MKLNLLLSVAFLFTILHLCKAGPLRLQKRAAFYIANETACVVDNIVYSNGEPIPTDDPCEACKCRPPGFACVLKECKVKPGCKAVRRVGECCPDFICGCEHNGRMYGDGEEIRDPKNPCYECHCQGSSIACAFVDCFFRDDCDSVYMPGECCPQYKNCTKDTPENNQFPRDTPNALPPLNLIPALNDDSIFPADFSSSSQTPEPSEKTSDPTQPPTPANIPEETLAPVEKYAARIPGESQPTELVSKTTEDIKLDSEAEDKNVEANLPNEGEKDDSLNNENNNAKEDAKTSEETKVAFNSETEIKKDDKHDSIPVKADPTQSSVEAIKQEEPQTTVSNELAEDKNTEVTEKSPESEHINTKIPESEKQIKNSAAENSKSLKISDEQLKHSKVEEEIKSEESQKNEHKLDETHVTESQTELPSEVQSEMSKGISTESKPESEEYTSEQTQTNPPAVSIYSNDKIKSESAETVTIVVHVREKSTPSIEKGTITEKSTPSTEKVTEETTPSTEQKDLVIEKVTAESAISTTKENLLKSNEELQSTEVNVKSTKDEVASTDKNFEFFASSTETSKPESTTNSPKTEKTEEKIEGRSDEADSTTDGIKSPTSVESDLKNEDTSVATTTQNINDAADTSKMTVSEVVEKTSANEPTTTDYTEIAKDKDHQTAKESENIEIKETKSEEKSKIEDELKVEANPEAREDESISEKNLEGTESSIKNEETTPAEKVKEPVSTESVSETDKKSERAQITTEATEIKTTETTDKETLKVTEKTTTEETKITNVEKNASHETTELKTPGTEE